MNNVSQLERVEYKTTDRGVIPVYADQIVSQPESYKPEEHRVWNILLKKQREHIKNKACNIYLHCLDKMKFKDTIPRFDDINDIFSNNTGWQLVAVNGLLSDVAFFDLLSKKQFPATWWIRKENQIDYIKEPDMFHDLFGHIPLLMDEHYSNAMQKFGEIGSSPYSSNPVIMEKLARMYWYSVEFGLIEEQGQIKAFGAGLLSSYGEILHALGDDPRKEKFKLNKVVSTSYKIDSYQPQYFVLDNFEHLEKELANFAYKYGNIKTI